LVGYSVESRVTLACSFDWNLGANIKNEKQFGRGSARDYYCVGLHNILKT
jgi:hypothetical protein